ncbi:DUF167 domain-containing protein [Desulforhopalus sp. 52FAK]
MAKFIPDNVLLYVEQRGGRAALESFKNSELGKQLDTIDFSKTAQKIGVSEHFTAVIDSIKNNYYKAFDNEVINEILGKRVGIAFFYPPKEINSYTTSSFLKENTLIIAEPYQNADLLAFLAKQYSTTKADISFQSIQYGNHQILRIMTPEGKLALSVIEGLIVASFNEKQLKLSIDAYDGEHQTIAEIPSFIKAQEKFHKPDRFCYLPVETIHIIANDLYDHVDPGFIPLIQEQLDHALGFTGAYYGAWSHSDTLQDKIIFTYNEGYTNNLVKNLLDTEPSNNTMLELTTADPLAYYWSNTIDLKHFLHYVPKDTPNPVTSYLNKLENLSQNSVEGILSTLGQEVSLVVEKSGEDNFIPIPLAAAFFRIDPNIDLSEMVNYIVDAFEVPVIEQIYDSVTYLYWVASPQDGLQPLCGYWSNLFFIGNSAQLLERVIDGYNENSSILNNPKVKGIDPGITQKNNSITYLNNTQIIELSKRLLGVFATIITLEDKGKAAKARVILSEVIHPLFDGLKEYQRSCTRSYFEPGMVIIDSRTSVVEKKPHKEVTYADFSR